jgi:hypothetical protein
MTGRRYAWVLVLAGTLALPIGVPAARAERPAETAAAFGLLGTWAVDCALPPSFANTYLTYSAAPGGNIAHHRDFGVQRSIAEIQHASLTAGGIELVAYFPALAQSRQMTIARSADDRIRTISDGFITTNEFTVRDGILLATGTAAPWHVRCR